MNISIIGIGYVGLTTAAFLSSLGHKVFCVDKDSKKITQLLKGKMPVYEPGLEELIHKNRRQLIFTTNLDRAAKESSAVFITVGTPSKEDGSTDLSYIYSVVDELAGLINKETLIIVKSTVPPGTTHEVKNRFAENGISPEKIRVAANPEFLREGSAVNDMFHPDRTIIGLEPDDSRSLAEMKDVYKEYEDTFLVTSIPGAELIKYASNAFLAAKISFINEIARICDHYDVDIMDVATGMGKDERIGGRFLHAGLGYGGSCFPKDVSSLCHLAIKHNGSSPILEAVQQINQSQVDYFIDKIQARFPKAANTSLTVWGIAFKPNTDDIRFSQAVSLIQKLAEKGYKVKCYDPVAKLPDIPENVSVLDNKETAVRNSDGLIIATDWDEFKNLDLGRISRIMKGNVVFDARNCVDPAKVLQTGMDYIGIGRRLERKD
ncbi:UDP-glucose dehydrogenase family protein [Sediminibacillus massiliensis]|uniref:UDP-glucose dehydrogenase family protein n=1 Tax=Sediminibacillus massiliensis TaxID=1926277 RepID=UPI0009888725|nr:UDP-glucose/GDP-mannose dehydrogenase family protein [Sediminibacillus massiliensis]